jgi:hypothetical protein
MSNLCMILSFYVWYQGWDYIGAIRGVDPFLDSDYLLEYIIEDTVTVNLHNSILTV